MGASPANSSCKTKPTRCLRISSLNLSYTITPNTSKTMITLKSTIRMISHGDIVIPTFLFPYSYYNTSPAIIQTFFHLR